LAYLLVQKMVGGGRPLKCKFCIQVNHALVQQPCLLALSWNLTNTVFALRRPTCMKFC